MIQNIKLTVLLRHVDLTSLIGGNYTNRNETLDSLEYEFISNVQLVQIKNENTKYFFNLKTGYYHHEFDQDIIADGTLEKDYRSDKHKFFVKPSLGTEMINGNKTIRITLQSRIIILLDKLQFLLMTMQA